MNLFSITNKRIVKAAMRKYLVPVVVFFVISLLAIYSFTHRSHKAPQQKIQKSSR